MTPDYEHTARELIVLRLREEQKLSFRRLGQEIGVSVSRAAHIYWKACRKRDRAEPRTIQELPYRLRNVLVERFNLDDFAPPESIAPIWPQLSAAATGNRHSDQYVYNLGQSSLLLLRAWLDQHGVTVIDASVKRPTPEPLIVSKDVIVDRLQRGRYLRRAEREWLLQHFLT